MRFSGGDSREETPVPIPNTEVKPCSADGTAWATAWESRTPPVFEEPLFLSGFFLSGKMIEYALHGSKRGEVLQEIVPGVPLEMFPVFPVVQQMADRFGNTSR